MSVVIAEWAALNANAPNSAYPSIVQVPGSLIWALSFDPSSDQTAWFDFWVPPFYRATKASSLRIFWSANSTAGSDANFSAACGSRTAGDAMNSVSLGTADASDFTDSTTAYGLVVSTLSLSNFPSVSENDFVRVALTFDVSESGLAAAPLVENVQVIQ